MQLPRERGPVSRRVLDALTHGRPLAPTALADPETGPVLEDEDVQLALWVLYELHYRGFDDVPDAWEWDLGALAMRAVLERRVEVELREATAAVVEAADDGRSEVGDLVLRLVADDDAPSIVPFLQRHATREQMCDYLTQRSVQQLKESDPQSFLLPRLEGAAKVALAELQYDEYGTGRPERLHQHLYAEALVAAGLDPTYGAYVDELSAASLASANVMSLFALNRRLRGASAGHFAAFEASSSVPSRKIAIGIERLGFPPAVAAYFHEHVEADAVHEQVAARDLCGDLVATTPSLRSDVLFGAAACLHVDAVSAADLLGRWGADAPTNRSRVSRGPDLEAVS